MGKVGSCEHYESSGICLGMQQVADNLGAKKAQELLTKVNLQDKNRRCWATRTRGGMFTCPLPFAVNLSNKEAEKVDQQRSNCLVAEAVSRIGSPQTDSEKPVTIYTIKFGQVYRLANDSEIPGRTFSTNLHGVERVVIDVGQSGDRCFQAAVLNRVSNGTLALGQILVEQLTAPRKLVHEWDISRVLHAAKASRYLLHYNPALNIHELQRTLMESFHARPSRTEEFNI